MMWRGSAIVMASDGVAVGEGAHGFTALALLADESGREELAGLVAGAYERARRDVQGAQRLAELLDLEEALGRHVLAHRRVLRRRAQVLADGQEVDAGRVAVA